MIPAWPWGRPIPSHAKNTGGTDLPRRRRSKPVTGFRTWRVKYDGAEMALWSLMQGHVWETSVTAECLPRREHEAPDPGCACGLYCQLPEHPLTEWEIHVHGRVRATGTVQMSGRIIVCDYGYKAQHAAIESPVVVDADCLGKECGNPVTGVVSAGWDFWCHCPDHPPTRSDAVLLEFGPWMKQTLTELRARYPGVEFLSWMEL